MSFVFHQRLCRLLLLLALIVGIFTSNMMAQASTPPKKKYHVTIYVNSISGSQGEGLYSLSILGKTTSSLGRVGDNVQGSVWYAPDPYLMLTVDVEDGVKTPITIGADHVEFISAWVPCADAFVTLESANDSDTGGLTDSASTRGYANIDLFYYYNNFSETFPFSITVHGVSPKSTGNGPQQPPAP